MASRISIADIADAKRQGKKITAVSCYDYTTARLVSQADVDMVLVGDSAAQILLGFDSTLPATMDFMVAITAAVGRGASQAFLVADMPFLSYQTGVGRAIENAGRFLVEAGAQMVKIEAGPSDVDVVKAVSDAGIAVMAHIGIKPQSISKTGRFKAEATTADMAVELIDLAQQMTEAGAASLLVEGTAAEVAKIITERSPVPVISCGSGPGCDGQILIAPDILGLGEGKIPKFSKNFASLAGPSVEAFQAYCKAVRNGQYPDDEHSYHMKAGQLERLMKTVKDKFNGI